MSDIVERLRAKHDDTWPKQIGYGDLINEDGPEAADEITRLRSLLKEAGEALETFDALSPKRTLSIKAPDYVNMMQQWTNAFKTARTVLSRIKGEA